MDRPRGYITKWSHIKTNIIGYHLQWNLKNDANEFIYREQTYGYQRGKRGRDKLGIWDNRHILLYIK